MTTVAAVLGTTLPALTTWRRRLDQDGAAGERPGRPEVIGAAAREQIRACYQAHVGQWGPQVLRLWCEREGLGTWSATTIAAVIADLREPEEPPPAPLRMEVTAPDVMWNEDGTGLRQGRRKRELLVVQDDHARLKLNWRLANGPARSADVVSYLQEAFQEHGAPLVLKHDGAGIFHDPQVAALLESYGVVALTSPPRWPGYNGKQERSMRDVRSYERALRRHGVRGRLVDRLATTMHDLNDERPRPVLRGRTAREAYAERTVPLPDRQAFIAAVRNQETRLLAAARSRREVASAHRRAVENTLVGDGLMVITGCVSHD